MVRRRGMCGEPLTSNGRKRVIKISRSIVKVGRTAVLPEQAGKRYLLKCDVHQCTAYRSFKLVSLAGLEPVRTGSTGYTAVSMAKCGFLKYSEFPTPNHRLDAMTVNVRSGSRS
jgi:hypothetical protein